MNDTEKIVVDLRSKTGKSATKGLRKLGMVPCILHDNGKSTSYATSMKDLEKILRVKRFFLTSFDLVDTKEKFVSQILVRDIEFHPVTSLPVHLDFLSVKKDTRVVVEVPLIFKNKDSAIGLKEGGEMRLYHYFIKMNIPFGEMIKEIEVDLGQMKLFDVIKVSDIMIPEKAILLNASQDDKIAFLKGNRAS